MRHAPYILAALFLSACAATSALGQGLHQAAVRPAPRARPPVMTPGYSPGTPAEPVYTPPGAGASRDRLPGASVPRSPNKRVLPVTKEAGVWAADGDPARASDEPLKIMDIALEVAHPQNPNFRGLPANACAAATAGMVSSELHTRVLMGLTRETRACILADLFHHCSSRMTELTEGFFLKQYEKQTKVADIFRAERCAGVLISGDVHDVMEELRDNFDHRLWEMAGRPGKSPWDDD